MLISVLVEFVLLLAFGLALSMLFVSPRDVTSGYFRNNSYVLLGLALLATLSGRALVTEGRPPTWLCGAAAALSYFASAAWLYEKPAAGRALLALMAACAGAALAVPAAADLSPEAFAWFAARTLSAGFLLGTTMAAMLLGHWYLNAPGMRLAPLKRLVLLMGVAAIVRGIVCAAAIVAVGSWISLVDHWPLVLLRWLAGIFGVLGVAVMTKKTLDIPNTQSATGILYVGVIATFIGELADRLLSAGAYLGL